MAVTWTLLDPLMTVLRPFAAVFSAIAAGVSVAFAAGEFRTRSKSSGPAAEGTGEARAFTPLEPLTPVRPTRPRRPPFLRRLAEGLRYGFVDMAWDVGPWFLIGVAAAGAVTAFAPMGELGRLVETYVGPGMGGAAAGYLVALALSLPIYVCATASTPMAAALVWQGLSPGAGMVFLLAGPATNIASLAVTAKVLGVRETVVYVAALVGSAFFMGALVDVAYGLTGWVVAWSPETTTEAVSMLDWLSAVAFSLLAAAGWMRRRLLKQQGHGCGSV